MDWVNLRNNAPRPHKRANQTLMVDRFDVFCQSATDVDDWLAVAIASLPSRITRSSSPASALAAQNGTASGPFTARISSSIRIFLGFFISATVSAHRHCPLSTAQSNAVWPALFFQDRSVSGPI